MSARHPAITTIKPNPRLGWPNFAELWQYRELLLTLTLRDIKVRYKQTALGIAWTGLQPFLTMVVLTLVFGRLAKMPSDGLPYPVFAMAALLPWQFFAKALNQGSMSLVSMQGMLTKVYFPRLFAPLSEVLSGVIDFAIAMVILLVMMAWYGVYPGWSIVALPLFLLLALVSALGVSLWLSALNVEFRDVQHLLPFLAQVWMFLTPVVYPASMIPEQWRWAFMLNPMAGVVEGFRWALLGSTAPAPTAIAISAASAVVALVTGMRFFDRCQRTLPDRV